MNEAKMTEFLDSLVNKGIPFGDCMVFENHQPVYRHMFGYVDEAKTKPVSDNQLYIMFSMTKVQTMTAVMQLVEQGRISLDDEVGKYLPAYSNLLVEEQSGSEIKCVPSKTPLLMRHLVSMQSGLDYDLERPGILRVLKEKGNKATTRELVDSFVETPLKFHPGTHFQYSLSHDVAAAVVEAVSGMKFGDYLKKNIWDPLKMKDTRFAKPFNEDDPRVALQYIVDGETGVTKLMDQSCNYQLSEAYQSGGAGLISSTYDYSLFGEAMAAGGISRDGVRIINPETIEIMKTNLLSDISREEIKNNMGRLGYGYGCGVQVLMEPELLNSKAPVGVFGWDGAAGSLIMMDTVNKLSLVFTMQVRNCGEAYGYAHPGLRELLYD